MSGSSGLGSLAIALTVLFVALKLLGVIAWAWLWVVSPIWICLALGIVLAIVAFVGVLAIAFLVDRE